MITDADTAKIIKAFRKVFVTKKDLEKGLGKIEKKLDVTIRTFDKGFNYHHRRLDQLEEKVGIKPPEFLQKIN